MLKRKNAKLYEYAIIVDRKNMSKHIKDAGRAPLALLGTGSVMPDRIGRPVRFETLVLPIVMCNQEENVCLSWIITPRLRPLAEYRSSASMKYARSKAVGRGPYSGA